MQTKKGYTMGYTHYWRQHRNFTVQEWAALTQYAHEVIVVAEQQGISLANGMGEVGTKPEVTEEGIYLNGCDPDAYETFSLRREKTYQHYLSRKKQDQDGCFAFCKTAHRPYDSVVVAILVLAHEIAPDAIKISSDGGPEALVPQFTDRVEFPTKAI